MRTKIWGSMKENKAYLVMNLDVVVVGFLLCLCFLMAVHYEKIYRDGLFRQEGSAADYLGARTNTKFLNSFLNLRQAAADLIWLDLIIKSDIDRQSSSNEAFLHASEAMLELDRYQFYGAWFSALYLSVIKDDKLRAGNLFQKTVTLLRDMPWVDSHLRGAIYFAYGYHLLFEVHDFESASEYIIKASQEVRASALSKELAESMRTPLGRVNIGLKIFGELYKKTSDEAYKNILEKKIYQLLQQRELLDLNDRFAIYLNQKKINTLEQKKIWFRDFCVSIGFSGKLSDGAAVELSEEGTIRVKTQ